MAQIDKINLSINEEKRKRDVKMKQLERQLTKADTIYDFFFAKGPQNTYQSRRVMATKKFAEAIRKIVEIREGARRTRSGIANSLGRRARIETLIEKFKKLMNTLHYVQALEGNRKGDEAVNVHKARFWHVGFVLERRRRYKAGQGQEEAEANDTAQRKGRVRVQEVGRLAAQGSPQQ